MDEKWEHQVEENDVLKEQLAEAQDQISHLTQAVNYTNILYLQY